MINEEWGRSRPGEAMVNFMSLMIGISVNALGNVIGGAASIFINSIASSVVEQQLSQSPELDTYAAGKLRTVFNPARGDALRTGLTIVAAWSAFESCFEDFCKGVIFESPNILDGKDLTKIKVPLSKLFSEGEEKASVIYSALEDAAGKAAGVTRCESILNYLDLGAAVPKPIRDTIYNSQMIRHIWAHRVGVADTTFVSKASHLGFAEGDLVAVDNNQMLTYLVALLMYSSIIANRHRAVHGLPPTDQFSKGRRSDRDAELYNAYYSLYPTMQRSAPDPTAPESSDPPQ